MALRLPKRLPNSLISGKGLTFLDLSNEVHTQIYKRLFDAAKRNGRYGETVRIGGEKTMFPQSCQDLALLPKMLSSRKAVSTVELLG